MDGRGQPQMGRRDGKRPTGDRAHAAQAKKVKYMSYHKIIMQIHHCIAPVKSSLCPRRKSPNASLEGF